MKIVLHPKKGRSGSLPVIILASQDIQTGIFDIKEYVDFKLSHSATFNSASDWASHLSGRIGNHYGFESRIADDPAVLQAFREALIDAMFENVEFAPNEPVSA